MEKKQSYSSFNLFIRSSIFFLIFAISIILYSFLVLLLIPFSLETRYYAAHQYFGFYLFILKKVCHLDYRVEGLDNIPKDRTGIIFSKHQSTWETFFIPWLFPHPAIILKRELLWIPFFGWALATIEPIVINRKKKSSAMQQVFQKGKQCLEAGRWILVFPEGTRVPSGEIGNYRLGGTRLAAGTGYPILPIALNSGRFWGKGQFIKRPGTIQVVIGPLIESQDRTPEELLHLAKTWIETTMIRIDRLVDEPTR